MDTGLSPQVVEKIVTEFRKFPQLETAMLYGSRALGTYKAGSDIDLSLLGENLNQELVWKVSEALEDTLLPYVFDLSLFEAIDNPELKEHITRVGVVFYQRDQHGCRSVTARNADS
jgi:predicted nucleotidyltransferase